MKQNLSSKKILPILVVVAIVSVLLIVFSLNFLHANASEQARAVDIRSVSPEIQADGTIVAQNQATLHFQIGGKLTYLPFKEGDTVRQGQTVASLDSTTLQKQLTQALNTYKSTRDAFDQGLQNQGNNVSQNQQHTLTGQSDTNYLSDVVKRIVDQNQASLDNSVLNVEIVQQSFQLSTLTSPLNGIVTHLDATTPGVNVTPLTSFVVADPSTLVFRANVSENDIDYVTEGSGVTVKISGGKKNELTGTVDKIYPDKITLPTGQKVYQVDIVSSELLGTRMGQNGTALIRSNVEDTVRLVPTWLVLNHDSVWVLSHGVEQLRSITIGKVHADMTEVLDGFEEGDQVITNPKSIAANKYQIL